MHYQDEKYEIIDPDSKKTLMLIGKEKNGLTASGSTFQAFDVRNQTTRNTFTSFVQQNKKLLGVVRAPEVMMFASNGVNMGETKVASQGFTIQTEFPDKEYTLNGSTACLGGSLCQISSNFNIKDDKGYTIAKIVRVKEGSKRKHKVPMSGVLIELSEWFEGDTIATFLASLLFIEETYFKRQSSFNCCFINLFGYTFPCGLTCSSGVDAKANAPNTLEQIHTRTENKTTVVTYEYTL